MVNSKLVVEKKECSQTGGKTEKEEEKDPSSNWRCKILRWFIEAYIKINFVKFIFKTFTTGQNWFNDIIQ